MRISSISMMNPYQVKSPAMKGACEDARAIRKFDEFTSKNDIVLSANIRSKMHEKDEVKMSLFQKKSLLKDESERVVIGTGTSVREAKLDIIDNYKYSKIHNDEGYYFTMPDFRK